MHRVCKQTLPTILRNFQTFLPINSRKSQTQDTTKGWDGTTEKRKTWGNSAIFSIDDRKCALEMQGRVCTMELSLQFLILLRTTFRRTYINTIIRSSASTFPTESDYLDNLHKDALTGDHDILCIAYGIDAKRHTQFLLRITYIRHLPLLHMHLIDNMFSWNCPQIESGENRLVKNKFSDEHFVDAKFHFPRCLCIKSLITVSFSSFARSLHSETLVSLSHVHL